MPEIVGATREDFVAIYGHVPPYSLQAYVIRDGSAPVAIGGLYYSDGVHVAFLNIAGAPRKRLVVQLCHKVMELIRQKRAVVYAVRDLELPTAPALLKHFGFEPVPSSSEVYLCQEP